LLSCPHLHAAEQTDREERPLSAEQALRIFVVDDERVISETLAKILQQSGFEAIPFTNPLKALNDSQFQSPDLLLSDVSMPELSGVDLAVQIKLKHPNCRILLFSGQASTVDLLQAARGQGYDFQLLSKPVHPKDLLRRIEDLF
jgi:DNA-binding NtrC family response regulator